MKAIIVISISIALLYGTEIFFWAALINGLAHLIFNYMKAYIAAIPAMKKFEMAVEELTARGASDEEIAALESFPVEPEDELRVPKWLNVVNGITSYMILVFILIGIVTRIF